MNPATGEGPRPRQALKQALAERRPIMGTFIQIGDPTIVEVLGKAGFDFGILDLEHGGLQTSSVLPMVRAADRTGLPLIVRLPMEKLPFVSQFLDSGARGVLAAKVGSVADAATVVGVALEGPRAIADVDAILSVPGLDFVFVGIFDLAASLGLKPGLDLPEIQDAVRNIAGSAARHGLAAGAWAPDPTMAQHWLDLGVTFLPVSLDVLMWRSLCMSTVADWRSRVDARGAAAG